MVLPELYNTRATQRNARNESVKFESCGTRKIKGGINLYIELQEHKIDHFAARNIRISLDKPIAFSK